MKSKLVELKKTHSSALEKSDSHRLRELTAKLRTKEEEMAALRQEVAALKKELQQSRAELTKAKSAGLFQEGGKHTHEAGLSKLQQQLDDEKAQRRADGQLHGREMKKLESNLKEAQQRSQEPNQAGVQREVKAIQNKLATAQQQLKDQQAALDKAHDQMSESKIELARMKAAAAAHRSSSPRSPPRPSSPSPARARRQLPSREESPRRRMDKLGGEEDSKISNMLNRAEKGWGW